MNTSQPLPWYRQFWPWFIIALPATAVIASLYTVYLAVQNEPSLVNDNYYQEGLSINDRLKQDQRAKELNMQANLSFSEQANSVNVFLRGNHQPLDSLILSISSKGNEALDQSYTLKAVNNNLFTADVAALPQGRFYIYLEPKHRQWRLLGDTVLPRQETLVLFSNTDSNEYDGTTTSGNE